MKTATLPALSRSGGLRRDPVFGVALLLVGLAAFPSLLPLGEAGRAFTDTVGWPLAIGSALLAILVRPSGEARSIRSFWWLIGAGYACYLAALVWRGVAPGGFARLEALVDLLYLACYLFIWFAFEIRPVERRGSRADEELRLLDSAGAAFFLFSLIVYMVLVPGVLNIDAYRSAVPSQLLFAVLDVFLVVRALVLRLSADDPVWRSIFAWLALTFAWWAVGDVVEASSYLMGMPVLKSGSLLDFIWFVPAGTQIVAARWTGADPLADSSGAVGLPRRDARLSPLVAYAFTFPILHFLFYRLGVLDRETHDARELLVLIFLGLSALLLWVYQRVLIRENGRLEEEQQAMTERTGEARRLEALGRLAGGVAHDFNNLLTVIRGRTELLLVEQDESHPHREDLEAIRDATRRGEGVTRQLLAFGRRQILRPEVIDLGAVVREMAPLLRSAISEEVRLSVDVADPAPLIVADQGQVEMALLNLAVNAREAMPGGGSLAMTVSGAELEVGAAAVIP